MYPNNTIDDKNDNIEIRLYRRDCTRLEDENDTLVSELIEMDDLHNKDEFIVVNFKLSSELMKPNEIQLELISKEEQLQRALSVSTVSSNHSSLSLQQQQQHTPQISSLTSFNPLQTIATNQIQSNFGSPASVKYCII